MFELLELFSNESTSPHPSVIQDNKGELKSGNCYKSTDWKCHRYTGWLLIVDIWNKLHKSTHSLCSWCLLKVQVDCQWWSGIQPSAMEATHLCIFTLCPEIINPLRSSKCSILPIFYSIIQKYLSELQKYHTFEFSVGVRESKFARNYVG